MKNKPEISVVMSVYNEPLSWLRESVNSILDQSFRDFEFLILLDNPKRKDLKVFLEKCADRDTRIKLFFNKQNLGLTKSLNKGLRKSKGKYIARMDADDISLPERFELQHSFLEKNRDIFLLGTGADYTDEKGTFIVRNIPPSTNNGIVRRLEKKNCLLHPTIMFRNKKNLRYRENLLYVEDYDFYLNLVTSGYSLANLRKPLLMCRTSRESIRHAKWFHQGLFALKARDFYFQRKARGVDEYATFDQNSILRLKENVLTKESLQTSIKHTLIFGDHDLSRKLLATYLQKYGFFNKFLFFYFLTFFHKRIISFALRFTPSFLLRKLNN